MKIPAKVRNFALANEIRLELAITPCGPEYRVIDPGTLRIVESTRTVRPKTCHAMAMMHRYLAAQS